MQWSASLLINGLEFDASKIEFSVLQMVIFTSTY